MKYPGWEEDAKKEAEYMKNCKGGEMRKVTLVIADIFITLVCFYIAFLVLLFSALYVFATDDMRGFVFTFISLACLVIYPEYRKWRGDWE